MDGDREERGERKDGRKGGRRHGRSRVLSRLPSQRTPKRKTRGEKSRMATCVCVGAGRVRALGPTAPQMLPPCLSPLPPAAIAILLLLQHLPWAPVWVPPTLRLRVGGWPMSRKPIVPLMPPPGPGPSSPSSSLYLLPHQLPSPMGKEETGDGGQKRAVG